jgi:hypothetical protein
MLLKSGRGVFCHTVVGTGLVAAITELAGSLAESNGTPARKREKRSPVNIQLKKRCRCRTLMVKKKKKKKPHAASRKYQELKVKMPE